MITILAPRNTSSFGSSVVIQAHQYAALQREIQLLRGETYKEYVGVAATLTEDGLDRQALDDLCWHILVRDPSTGDLAACARYRHGVSSFEELLSHDSAIASGVARAQVIRAFANDKADAKRRGIEFGEASGLAVKQYFRSSYSGAKIVMLGMALSDLLGGGSAWSIVSTRHGASSMLCRLGAQVVCGLAPHVEPRYGHSVRLLHLDVARIPARFEDLFQWAREELGSACFVFEDCAELGREPEDLPLSLAERPPAYSDLERDRRSQRAQLGGAFSTQSEVETSDCCVYAAD